MTALAFCIFSSGCNLNESDCEHLARLTAERECERQLEEWKSRPRCADEQAHRRGDRDRCEESAGRDTVAELRCQLSEPLSSADLACRLDEDEPSYSACRDDVYYEALRVCATPCES